MAFEILNHAQTTPRRLFTLLQLFRQRPEIERNHLLDLLQHQSLGGDQAAAKTVINSAMNFGVIENSEQRYIYRLAIEPSRFASLRDYRFLMQEMVLGETDSLEDHYLFSEYLAWYAVQDEQVLYFTSNQYYVGFNNALHRAEEHEQAFNSTKFSAWRRWAAFLGCGWLLPSMGAGAIECLVPDATNRIAPIVSALLPTPATQAPFRSFMDKVAANCPELDGGPLFKRGQAASNKDGGGNQLSLMLSNALRRLAQSGVIVIEDVADASDRWHLFPATGSPIHQVTHIRREESL